MDGSVGTDEGVEVVTAIEEGTPERNVVGYVEEAGIDLIVMGTHGRTDRDRPASLGSVTDRVVKNVDVPVWWLTSAGSERAAGHSGAGHVGRDPIWTGIRRAISTAAEYSQRAAGSPPTAAFPMRVQ